MSKRIRGGKISAKQKLEIEHRRYNKEMRQIHCHHMQKTFDEYVEYKYGYSKVVKPRKLPTEERLYQRPEQDVPSHNGSLVPVSRTKTKEYTGELVTGIATMHKSNGVPVINRTQAEDLAHMRR